MALPPLATVEALAAWVGEEIAADDARAAAVVAAASALVRAHTGKTWVDDEGELEVVPDEVAAVVVQVAARVWRNPAGVIHDVTGPFSVRYSEKVSDGLYLTADEKDMLSDHRELRKSGIAVLSTTRGDIEDGTLWVDVDGQDKPIQATPTWT